MLQFANPVYLWLVLAVPPLVWWWMRQRRSALRHPAVDRLPALPDRRARQARWGGALLRGSSLLALAVAAAGPRLPDLHTRIDTEGIALVLVVDVSGSMAERDFDWNGQPVTRLEAVKKVFNLFVAGPSGELGGDGTPLPPGGQGFEGRATDLIGLVTFASRPETLCPLTLSHSVLLRMLAAEDPRSVPGESETNISDALAVGLHRLRHAGPRRKVLVLLTDGEHNVTLPRSDWTPRQAGQVAAGLGIPIYAIDAGGLTTVREPHGDAPLPETSTSPAMVREQAVQTLQDLARMTRGQYFTARDTASLLRACRSIDALERSEVTSFQYRRYHEGYPYFALTSLALFALVLGLEQTIWRRVP
jgi:Ca-activated chloride channel family protein